MNEGEGMQQTYASAFLGGCGVHEEASFHVFLGEETIENCRTAFWRRLD